uniref:Uncharacterized protein n=1 Tax=Hyaloperonospora arabidopsidis (strain Emoy2) TaxID=559515 RepID=M4C4X1_HYAAE
MGDHIRHPSPGPFAKKGVGKAKFTTYTRRGEPQRELILTYEPFHRLIRWLPCLCAEAKYKYI